MSEFLKTVVFVAVALVLTGAALVTTRDRAPKGAEFNDQGEAFFPEFQDPLTCTDLEVISFEPSTATTSRFRVMFKDGKWVIPSHSNYPADARDRLSKTAAAVMDLTKDTIRSDRPDDQAAMGVIDPLDTKTAALEGRGQRVTLRDATEKVLADFIIGSEIKGTERKGEPAQHFVRVPGQKRTYGVNVKAELSTRFADWIETNLLKLEASKVRRVVFDNYHPIEARDAQGIFLQIERGDRTTIERNEGFGPWTKVTIERPDAKGEGFKTSGLPADKEVNEEQMRSLTDALADLKIAGVRPKPPGLKDPTKPGFHPNELVQAALRDKGFYALRDGRLFSDQGDVIVTTDEGVVYTLRYGGPVFARGDELTAGTPDTAAKKDADKDKNAAKNDADKDKADGDKSDKDKTKDDATQEHRYLMVTVSFDPTIIPKPKKDDGPAPRKVEGPLTIPEDPFAPDPKDPKYIADQKAAEDKAKQAQADYDQKLADGKKRVEELSERFGPWYYVTPGSSFNKINLDPTLFFKAKGAPPSAPGAPGAPGAMPFGAGAPMPGPFAPGHP